MAHPDFTLPFDLYVDASDEALGMVLGQVQNGREVVISYSCRKLLPAEKNYSVTEREALAVVVGIKYFQPYVYGRIVRKEIEVSNINSAANYQEN